MKETGRPKTSIYEHIKDIPLSHARMEQYRVASGEHIRKFALARKGKSVRAFRPFRSWSPETVLLVAHLLFDGEIVRTKCVYNNRSEALIERVKMLLNQWYDFEPKRYENLMTGVHRISYHNVALAIFLHEKSQELLSRILTMPLDFKREFIRAFFDDEGCMDFRLPGHRRVRGYQKDIRILQIIKVLLADLGIKARIQLPNEVVIIGKENLLRFEQEINFSHGVYINGKRSNSRWKKDLEKRAILRMAIESYQS